MHKKKKNMKSVNVKGENALRGEEWRSIFALYPDSCAEGLCAIRFPPCASADMGRRLRAESAASSGAPFTGAQHH